MFSRYWFPQIPLWAFSIIYSSLGLGINLLGVKDFGEVESFFSIVKITTLVLFIIFGILFISGYVSPKGAINGSSIISLSTLNWFPKGIKGLWSSMIFALFPFAGVVVVEAASKELKKKETISKAIWDRRINRIKNIQEIFKGAKGAGCKRLYIRKIFTKRSCE